jgi:hypothetical protein
MRILLDAKDLINAIEHSRPVTAEQLNERLRAAGHQLVLTATNVREFAAGAEKDNFLPMRSLLQRLEAMPVTYIREWNIQRAEILAARSAYQSGTEPSAIDPYVARWDYALFPGRPPSEIYVGYRLDEIIYDLWKQDPELLLYPKRISDRFGPWLESQRELLRSEHKSDKQLFIENAPKYLSGVGLPTGGFAHARWGKWVYSNPERCPGLVLSFLTLRGLIGNTMHAPKGSVIPDTAYVAAVPYVDAITLDASMFTYVSMASRKLRALNSATDFSSRLFRNVESVLDVHC